MLYAITTANPAPDGYQNEAGDFFACRELLDGRFAFAPMCLVDFAPLFDALDYTLEELADTDFVPQAVPDCLK